MSKLVDPTKFTCNTRLIVLPNMHMRLRK